MTRDEFWKIIDRARKDAEDAEEVAATVEEKLIELPDEEIVSFGSHIDHLMLDAYRWDLWAVAYIIQGGCSDDGFDYFCGWLIANGRKRWEAAMADPESVGRYAEEDEAECEEMLSVAMSAYRKKTGNELPLETSLQWPESPAGKAWSEEELEMLYPKLWRKFE